MSTKVTVNLPDNTVAGIKNIADSRGVTYTEAIRQAIESERFLREEMAKGSEILIKKPDGSYHRLILR